MESFLIIQKVLTSLTHTHDIFSRESDSTTTNVRSSVRLSVRLSVTKTPKQLKINHSTLPQHSPSLTPSHTTSQTPSHTQHHNKTSQHNTTHYITSQHHTQHHNTTSPCNITHTFTTIILIIIHFIFYLSDF